MADKKKFRKKVNTDRDIEYVGFKPHEGHSMDVITEEPSPLQDLRKYKSELPQRKKTERTKDLKKEGYLAKEPSSALEEFGECEIFINPKQQEQYEKMKSRMDAENAELIENQYSQYVNDIGNFLNGPEEEKEGNIGVVPQFLKLDEEESEEEDREDQNWDDTPKHEDQNVSGLHEATFGGGPGQEEKYTEALREELEGKHGIYALQKGLEIFTKYHCNPIDNEIPIKSELSELLKREDDMLALFDDCSTYFLMLERENQ